MGRIGFQEILLILLIVLLLFGAKKLPEIGNALGKAIKEFRKAGREMDGEVNKIDDSTHEKKS
jgi:sec-independent protein translocase protein TatA